MYKYLFLFCGLLCLNNAFAQNYNWITPNKTYLKMYLYQDGMYRINKTDFTNAGIVATIDPRTVKVFNKGVEIPIFFNGEIDGIFDPADYFDFYGKRNTGGMTKTYEASNVLSYTTNEYYNSYSDTNVYWVDWGGSNGLRMTQSSFSTGTNYLNPFFNELVRFERDYFYSQGEALNGNDQRFLSTDKFRGEGWYWSTLGDNQTLSDTFSAPNLYTVPQTASIRVFAYPTNRNTTIFNEHTLQVRINGNLVATLFSNDMNRIDSTISFSSSLLSNVSVNNVAIKYVPAAGYSGSMYLDLFEVQYPKIFKFNSSKFTTALGGVDTTSKLFRLSGFNSFNPINLYDVANNIKIITNTFNIDTLKFTGKSNAKFELINSNITNKPFRIKQKQVPNLVSTSNGADYLLIYNNLFLAQAEQLRAYRASYDSFRSFKAEIEDIYDIFNFGLEDPVAVRNFTKYVYDSWQLPKLSYICLLGRASLDPKKNLSTSTFYQNLIPTYGYPPSDGYFANFNIGTFCYYDMVAIGRLPVYSTSEAQSVVDKIIAYESNPPARWWKNYTFVTMGGTAAEQNTHKTKSEFEINTYITQPPLSGDPHRIFRSDLSGSTTFNMRDSLRNDIDRGTAFVNYRGHAGSHDWEVAMSDPNTLNNGSKLPIVLSLTCFTGENSQPNLRGFGEKFMYVPNKGSIGFVGTTGWSYTNDGNDFGTHMLQTIKSDTARRLGNIVKYANKRMSQDSLAFSTRHTLNCYVLLGDPATTLNIPVRPEFAITNSDYKLSNNFPNVGDNITLTVYPRNYGLYADSCKIRMQVKKDGQDYFYKDTIRRQFKLDDTISYNIKIDSLGIYSAVVSLDYNNWYPLELKTNNSITISIPVKNTSYIPLKPVTNSVVSGDSVQFVGLNPRVNSLTNTVKVILQMDTTKNFNSPLIRNFASSTVTGVSTKFKTSIPAPVNNRIYFWRTNSIINGDSSGWSDIQNFVYSLNQKAGDENNGKNLVNNISLNKYSNSQYSSTDFSNIAFKTSAGIELSEYSKNLYVRSYGSNGDEASYFSVGNQNIYIDGGLNTGLSMIKVKKLTGSIQDFKNLKMNTATSSDSLVSFLNTFDSTSYLMLLNAAYFQANFYLSTNAKTKLKQFGSIYCDSIGLLGYFHSWSLIGYLGATSLQTSESFDPCCRPAPACVSCDHWTQAISSLNADFKNTAGTVSNIVGPAQTWGDLSWSQTLYANSTIKFDIYGINSVNQQVLLMSNLQTNQFTDLSLISASQYPKLNIVAKINIDTAIGKLSSILNSVKVNYEAPAEITWEINSFTLSSSNKVGETLKFNFRYHNPGYYNLSGVIINTYKKSVSAGNLIKTDTSLIQLKIDSSRLYSAKVTIPYFRDSMKMLVEVKPLAGNNEFYTYNNYVEFSLNNPSVALKPSLQVFSDGQLISGGEYVSRQPEIKITYENESDVRSDSSQLLLRVNDEYVQVANNSTVGSMIHSKDSKNPTPESDQSLIFYPKLVNGTNKLLMTFYNETGSRDSVTYDVIVSDQLLIKDFYNFPNPMRTETSFVFNIASSASPDKFKIKIYTVSGKLIKQIEQPVNVGYNQIAWDGRDDDGDVVANGTYLYKLVTGDEEGTETQIQKLVVLR